MMPVTEQYLRTSSGFHARCLRHLPLLLGIVVATPAEPQSRSGSEVVYVTDAERLFVRATGRYERGEYERALKDYVKLSEMRPNQRTTAGLLMMSMAQVKLEHYDDALATARRLDREYPNSRYGPDARLVAGDCYYHLRRYYEAAEKYGRLLATPAPLELQASAAERLAGVVKNSTITAEAQDLTRLQMGETRMRDALLYGEARWYMRLGWGDQARVALEQYIERVPNGIFIPMARRSLQMADASAARRAESPTREVVAVGEPGLKALEQLRSEEPSSRLVYPSPEAEFVGFKPSLGVLLPLSGPDGHYGSEILAGIRLANVDAGDLFDLVEVDTGWDYPTVQSQSGSERLKIVQSEGSKLVRNLHGVRRLAEDQDVVAIIGPIFSTSAVVAAAIAENAGVPLITPLAQQSGLDSLGDFIFQLSMVSEVQARALAEYSTLVLGMETLVVLAPLTDYGWSFTQSFTETAEANGGRVVTAEWYVPEETTDFKNQFLAIRQVGFSLMAPPEPPDTLAVLDALSLVVVDAAFEGEQAFVELLESGLVDAEMEEPDSTEIFIDTIDAIAVIVESFEDARRIAPQLTFFRFDTQMLGNDIWYEPEAIRQMSRPDREHLRGCIFVSGRREASAAERDFTDRFRTGYGTDPLYAGFGYDAVSIVAAGWHQQHQSRRSMREWLAALRDYDGASGRIGFSPGRRVNDELSLLKIASDGRLMPLLIDDLPDMSVPEDDLPALDMLDSGTEFVDRDSLFLED